MTDDFTYAAKVLVTFWLLILVGGAVVIAVVLGLRW